MYNKNQIYFDKIRGDTLNTFCFHFWMMFIFPLSTFFLLRWYLESDGYDEMDATMYSAFAAVGCVQIVIIHYVIVILRDPDSFAPEEKPKQAIKPVIPKVQRNEIKQSTIDQMRAQEEKEREKDVQKESTIDDPKNKAGEKKKKDKKKEESKVESKVTEEKASNQGENETKVIKEIIEPKKNASNTPATEKEIIIDEANIKTKNKKKVKKE